MDFFMQVSQFLLVGSASPYNTATIGKTIIDTQLFP